MKKHYFTLLCALTVLLLCGCTQKYIITLNNGSRITTMGKPKYDQGIYIVKDASGQKGYVPAGRVREIAPASEVIEEDKTRFNPSKR